jgi:DNA polymerase
MAYAFDDEPVDIILPMSRNKRIFDHVRRGDLVCAHNVAFELGIWNDVLRLRDDDWPPLSPQQTRCTMALCLAMGLPASLGAAAQALGIPERKDTEGRHVMLELSRPKADGGFSKREDDPAKFDALYEYCKQDVATERALHKQLKELSASERNVWVLDHRINQRGVLIDLEAVRCATALVAKEQDRLNGDIMRATGGAVRKCTETARLTKWICAQGVAIAGVAKGNITEALRGNTPPQVRTALELRKDAARSSAAKLVAMQERASADGRVRYVHQFHGAATGRWAGRGVQTQNLIRPRPATSQKHIDDMFAHLEDGDYLDMFHGPIMDAVADCQRGMFIAPPGRTLVAVDFNAIEARVLPWLAGDERVLSVFRAAGDIYKAAAVSIYGIPIDRITTEQRRVGKVATLALGYGGGPGAFQQMARSYDVNVPDATADEIKIRWREAHPQIVGYWHALEEAAIRACHHSGEKCSAGPAGRDAIFLKRGSFLFCRLPSGRVISYPYPEVREIETPWGELKDVMTYMTTINQSRKAKVLADPNANGSWQRVSTFGGSLAENVTQALASCLLRHALLAVDAAGFDIVMHVHDEVVVEVAAADGAAALRRIIELMSTPPVWAKELPLAADGWHGARYRK